MVQTIKAYKHSWKQTLKAYKSNMGTNINTSLFNEHTSLLVMHLKHIYL